jgi:uncharacterized protein DUF6578
VRKVVWVDDWQLDCCGDSFAVGDVVNWTVIDEPGPTVLIDGFGADPPHVDCAEEHHGGVPEGTPPIRGVVKSIRAVHSRTAPSKGHSRVNEVVPGSAIVTRVRGVDRIATRHGYTLWGYLVELDLKTARARF